MSPAPRQDGGGLLRRAAWGALLLLPAVAVFAPGLSYPFLQLDDVHHVVLNPAVQDLSWRGLHYIFVEDTRDLRYFPLTYLSLAVDRRLFGLDPFFFHATNLALHLANTLLVAWLVERIFRDRALGFLTALLFSIHPLQVESVAWIISRKNVLFLFFFLLAAHAYLARFGGSAARARAALAASALGYGLACLSKTAAITLPAALVLVDWVVDPRCRTSLAAWLRRSLPSKLVYVPVLALIVWASVRHAAPNPFQTDPGFDAIEWIAIVGHNLFFYVAKTLLPLGLGVFYPLPSAGALPSHVPLFACLGAGLVAAAIWSWRRAHARLFFGLGWYLVTIAPMTLFAAWFSDVPILAADRYYYQSAIGLLLLPAATALHLWRSRPRLRPLVAAAGGACVVALAILAADHRAAWRSTTALYEETLAHHPNREFQLRLALEYQGAGRRADALRALAAADHAENQVFFMDFLYYRLRLARLRLEGGDLGGAAREVEAGIESTPNAFEPRDARTPLAHAYLADLLRRAGDDAGAARARARRGTPDSEQYFERTWIQVLPEEATRFLADRVAADPDDGEAWFFYGLAADLAGDEAAARSRLARAHALGYRPP